MGEENRRWRCPYCDGRNDWQNEVCEICGDGRRDEAESAEKAASTVEMPKTYTPRERVAEPAAPKREPEREAPRPAYAPTPAPEPPKKKKKGGIWVAIVIIALAALGGRFLAKSFVASMEKDKTDAIPAPIATPEATQPPEKTPAEVNEPSPPTTTVEGSSAGQLIATFDVPDKPVASIESITMGDKGTALLRFRSNNCTQTDFYISYCVLKDQNEDPQLATWRQGEEGLIDSNDWRPSSQARSQDDTHSYRGPLEEPALVRVFPGHWMQFYVVGLGGFHNSACWTTGPVYIPEFTGVAVPSLRFTDFIIGKYDNDAHGIAEPYTLTTARDLNGLLEQLLEAHESSLFEMEYHFQMDCSAEELLNWDNSFSSFNRPKCCAVLYAPDFVKLGTTFDFDVYESSISGQTLSYKCPAILSPGANNPRDGIGWYPAGDYTLAFYVDGTCLGSVSFTLN